MPPKTKTQVQNATVRTFTAIAPEDLTNFEVTVMSPGNGNGYEYPAHVLQSSAPLFDHANVFANHPDALDRTRPGCRKIEDLAGILSAPYWLNAIKARFTPGGPKGSFVAALARQIIHDRSQGLPVPNIGLSADIDILHDDGTVTEICLVHSVDVVFNPARGGSFDRVLNSLYGGTITMEICPVCQSPLDESGNCPNNCQPITEPSTQSGTQSQRHSPLQKQVQQGTENLAELQTMLAQVRSAQQDQERLYQENLQRQCAALLTTALNASDLPDPMKDEIRQHFTEKHVFNAEDLNQAIKTKEQVFAKLLEDHVITGLGEPRPVMRGMWNSLDRIQLAANRLLGLQIPSEHSDVPRLSGIRELYVLLTGDYDLHGRLFPERVALANVTTSTVTSVVKNALNLVMLDYFNLNPRWWAPIAYEEDFPTMNDVTWITTGGFADLATVTEGAAYAELSWSDNEEVTSFVKKGNYVGITLEMIDRDRVAAVKAIPRKIGIASWRTLSSLVSALFTDNSGTGPTMDCTHNVFDATNHSNLLTTALSATAWDAVVQAMFKQAEATSSKRLGLRPAYLLIPIELEKLALEILTSEGKPGTADNDRNVRMLPADRIITVPEWTDANNWAATADPKMAQGVCIGYRFGREPEMFIAEEPIVGSMFTNDEMRIKARFITAVGVGDYRALHKNNVA